MVQIGSPCRGRMSQTREGGPLSSTQKCPSNERNHATPQAFRWARNHAKWYATNRDASAQGACNRGLERQNWNSREPRIEGPNAGQDSTTDGCRGEEDPAEQAFYRARPKSRAAKPGRGGGGGQDAPGLGRRGSRSARACSTPRSAWSNAYREFFKGYEEDPVEALSRTFEEVGGYDDVVMLRDIEFNSHCEHHMVPFIGRAHVAYLPSDQVVGISKLARVVEIFARRLQTQETMTAQIAHAIDTALAPRGVAVMLEAVHQCMSLRGVNKRNVATITTQFTGEFKTEPAAARPASWSWCAARRAASRSSLHGGRIWKPHCQSKRAARSGRASMTGG